jgi:glutathione reductase (NADPH)
MRERRVRSLLSGYPGWLTQARCVPKKLVWHAAALSEAIKHSHGYCFSVEQTAPFNWALFKKKRDAYIARLNGIYERNLDNEKVERVHGRASFVAPREVRIERDDGTVFNVRGKHILIATGGRPALPPGVEGAELGITSDGFFELEAQPKKVAVVGAGYIAVEFAGMFNALGTETHLFIRHDNFLRTFDEMIQTRLATEYERQGIHLHRNSAATKVVDKGDGWKAFHYNGKDGPASIDVDCVVWAVGRTPETHSVGLDVAGVKTNAKGEITVDAFQNTSAEGVHAVGDVCDSGFELTPVAIAAGRRLSDRLFGAMAQRYLTYADVPSVVFAHPEVGSVGLTEAEARKKFEGKRIKIYESGFISMYNSMLEPDEKTRSTYKLVCVGDEEKVVGLHILGEGSSEILQGFGVAVKMGATKKDFDECVAIHPTSAEELVTMR